MVLLGLGYGLERFFFPVTSIWMLVGVVFSHDKFGDEGVDEYCRSPRSISLPTLLSPIQISAEHPVQSGDDKYGYELHGGKFILFACESLPLFGAKGLGFNFPSSEVRMTVVDGEMVLFLQIGVISSVTYPFEIMILDGGIYGTFKISCLSSIELPLFRWFM
ncbi:hypothetical protein EJB05_50586, partial [Eragrostis curvula]